mgnify:CR=1 FL=1
MNRISVELVPHDEKALRSDLALVQKIAPAVNLINIPDLLRLDMRSWEGAVVAKAYYNDVMPHIRAMDINLDEPLSIKDFIDSNGIKEVLIIEGDPPQDMRHKVYPTMTTDVIRKFHAELPNVKVFAGIDQYRGSIKEELYRIERKKQAGAAGFFTQPFFDMHFMSIYADILDGVEVYWGISPVISQASKSYWERKNNVVFPHSFKPTLKWSIDFAHKAMEFADQKNSNVYFMPIVVDLTNYFNGIFPQ